MPTGGAAMVHVDVGADHALGRLGAIRCQFSITTRPRLC